MFLLASFNIYTANEFWFIFSLQKSLSWKQNRYHDYYSTNFLPWVCSTQWMHRLFGYTIEKSNGLRLHHFAPTAPHFYSKTT